MTIEVKMPALSPTMEKGTLAKWLVGVGDVLKPGDLMAEIETDKATMEFEAVDAGRIVALIVAEGTDDVPIGTVIATIASEEEGAVEAAPPASPPVVAATPAPAPDAEKEIARPIEPVAPTPVTRVEPVAQVAPQRARPEDRVKVSPLAARIAEAKGIDLSAIKGTGPNGRIVRADLALTAPSTAVAPAATVAPAIAAPIVIAPPPEGVPFARTKLSGMRKTIARRLTEAKQSVPHFYLTVRCRLDALIALRGELNQSLAGRGIKLSVNDMLIKAMAIAMEEVPETNVQFAGDEMYQFSRVDIAMAVAIEGGLITPVLHDVGSQSLASIARQSKALSTKAREGKLLPEDYQGGTASISNLGMFGIDEIVPVINPPQALILGVGASIEQPWKVNGGIALASITAATASFDHRVIDGATGARFMAALRDLLETPNLLLV